jgi:hypothetical protein
MFKYEFLNYLPTSREEVARKFSGATSVRAICVVTTADDMVFVRRSQRQIMDEAVLVVPSADVSAPHGFEAEILQDKHMIENMSLPKAVVDDAEVTYMGSSRLVSPVGRQLIVPCAVELDIDSTDLPPPFNPKYEWMSLDEAGTWTDAANVSQLVHVSYGADSHYAIEMYLDMTSAG